MHRRGGLVEPGLNRACLVVRGALGEQHKVVLSAMGARDGLGRRGRGCSHQTGPLDPRLAGRPRFALYGSRASLAAARPEGSSSQPRWSRPNPQGGCPGLGSLAAPRSAPCRTATTRAVAIKQKGGGSKNGTPPESSTFNPSSLAAYFLLAGPLRSGPAGRVPSYALYLCAIYVARDAAALDPLKKTLRGQPGTRTHTVAPYCVFLYLICILFFFLFFFFPPGEDS